MTGELAALGSAVVFGLSLILARRSMVAIAPEAGVLVSIAFNVLAFVLLTMGAAWRGLLPPIDSRSIVLFVLGGLAGTLLGRNLSYQSMEKLGATLMTSIRLSNSAFTLLLGYVLLHELPRPWQLAGLVLVTTGLWLSLRPARRLDAGLPRSIHPAGVMMAVASAAAFAFGDTARRLGLKITPAPVFGAAVGASAALMAHLVWGIFRHSARWPSGQVLRRLDLLASAVFNTMAILLLYVALRHAPVAIVSVLYNLQVLVVLLFSPVILRGQEILTGWLVAGTCVALIGTVLILLG